MSDSRGSLAGVRVLVTRSLAQAGPLESLLADAGATVIVCPLTRTELLDPAPLRAALDQIDRFRWVAFTSQNAVDAVARAANDVRLARLRAHRGICIVGDATARALRDLDVEPALVSAVHTGAALAEALCATNTMRGARVLHLAAEHPRPELAKGLHDAGAQVETLAVYRTVPDAEGTRAAREALAHGEVDLLTFLAPSAVEAFVAAVGAEQARGARAAVIGPTTADAARRAGMIVAAEASPATVEGLVEAAIAARVPRQPTPAANSRRSTA